WRWQMLMPAADESHERLCRQMLRWLAQDSLERVTVTFDKPFYNVGDTVNVSVKVLNERYQPDNNASLWLQRNDPLGNSADIAMEWDINQDGTYQTQFVVEDEGVYRVLVDVASAAGTGLETDKSAAFVVTPSLREFNDAGRDAGLLARIAEAGGGRYYDISQTSELLTGIDRVPTALSREVQEDLWDKPWLLALLVLLMSA